MHRTYTLLDADRRSYLSDVPGTLGGHRPSRIYGRLDCPSARRAIARGGYTAHRVFFADENAAIAAGFRPCAVCLPGEYALWKAGRDRPAPAEPCRHAEAEVAALAELLAAARPAIAAVSLGHGRQDGCRAAVEALATRWRARGGTVLATVDWPETAASWSRQARRFTSADPDAWVVAGAAAGWAGMSRRLRLGTGWNPARTYGLSCAADPRAMRAAGPGTLEGIRGVDVDGGTWLIGRHLVTHRPPDAAG